MGPKREEVTRENYIMKRTDAKRWSKEETRWAVLMRIWRDKKCMQNFDRMIGNEPL